MTHRFLLIFLLLPFAAAAQVPVQRAVSITFDDLPFASVPTEDGEYLGRMTTLLLQSLQTDRGPPSASSTRRS